MKSTQLLRDLEISLRTNEIQFVITVYNAHTILALEWWSACCFYRLHYINSVLHRHKLQGGNTVTTKTIDRFVLKV